MELVRKTASKVLAWLFDPSIDELRRRRAQLIAEHYRLAQQHRPREHVRQEIMRLTNDELRRGRQ